MAEKKQENFIVNDRRLFTADGELRQEASEEQVSVSSPAPESTPAATPSGRPAARRQRAGHDIADDHQAGAEDNHHGPGADDGAADDSAALDDSTDINDDADAARRLGHPPGGRHAVWPGGLLGRFELGRSGELRQHPGRIRLGTTRRVTGLAPNRRKARAQSAFRVDIAQDGAEQNQIRIRQWQVPQGIAGNGVAVHHQADQTENQIRCHDEPNDGECRRRPSQTR